MQGLSAGAWLAIYVFLGFLLILWVILPYIILSLKDRLDIIIRENQNAQEQIIALLKEGNAELKEANKNSKASALFLKASLGDRN